MEKTTEYKEALKVLPGIINEPNEFKRYMLLQLWCIQFYTNTITDPIQLHENRLKDTTNITTDMEVQSLYDVLRAIKTSLTIKNEELSKVLLRMKQNMNIIKVLNQALELNNDKEQNEYIHRVNKLEKLIASNNNYITNINNLSEAKITSIINDSEN